MSIDFSQIITAETKQQTAQKAAYDSVAALRRAAYQVESDPLRLEIAYDALSQGQEPDFSAWIASVAAIKLRYPLPEPPKA